MRRRRRDGRPLPSWRRTAGAALAAAALGAGLAACGSSSPDAHAACSDVYKSLATYNRSLHESPARRAAGEQLALDQLRAALTPAANAGTQYQALMTTINESPTVPEGTLEHALEAQCHAITSATGASGPSGPVGGP